MKFYFFIALMAIMITAHACLTFRMSSKKIDRFFKDRHIEATQESYTIRNRTTHYVKTGDDSKPLVLFVHGSPGSLSAFIDYLADTALLEKYLLITADRPGFGYSNFGIAEPSLEKQAASLLPILQKYHNNRPITLVGHSLGGPVIARMAIDYPDLVDNIVFVAASIDPDLEPNETWFRAPLATPFLNWILPRSFHASNMEIYHLKPQLEDMKSLWKDVKANVIFIQGGKDVLVDPRNAAFAQQMITNTSVKIHYKKEMNHFIPWTHPEVIRQALLDIGN